MESSFRQDFSRVRVHTGPRAEESVKSVNALAYTVGPDVVFGAGQYTPGTNAGQKLLAHELAHVVQQSGEPAVVQNLHVGDPSDAAEQAADKAADSLMTGSAKSDSPSLLAQTRPSASPQVRRKVVAAGVNCTAGTLGAPSNPVAELTAAEARAQALAQGAAVLAEVGSAAASIGINVLTTPLGQSYQNRFGIPPPVKGGFMNRLTGQVAAAQSDAISSELELLSGRLERIGDNFDQTIAYGCIGGPATFKGCTGHCSGREATACPGISAILICPGFWGHSEAAQATLLIHESAHMLWANVLHGRNFRHASCYANFVADLFNAPTTGPACTP